MSSAISHKIKKRINPQDVFITPVELVKKQISFINHNEYDVWLDPCCATGNYLKNFPTKLKDYCEITKGKDFFEYIGNPDIICMNHPYSITDKWFKKCISLNPRIISALIAVHALTPRRIEWFKNAGYGITRIHLCKVWRWYDTRI